MSASRITIQGFPNITVTPWTRRPGDTYGIRYCGTAEDLIAAGAVTADMLSENRRGKGKRDSDGDRYVRKIYYRVKRGRPERCYRVIRWKLKALIRQLPGGNEALAEGEREAARRAEYWKLVASQGAIALPALGRPAMPAGKRPAYLRLVVDNT